MSEDPDTIRILHIDDEPDFVELAATFLERFDERFVIETATSAEEGLDKLAETPVDCVVSDYDMPGQNGIELLETVRDDHPDLPFVLFTGKGSEEVASDAISAGVTDYLQKSGGTDQYILLGNRVQNAVKRFRAEVEVGSTHEWYRRLTQETTDVIVVLDPNGNFKYLSPSADQILGYTPEELEGEVAFEFVHPDDREKVMELFFEMVNDPSLEPTTEFRFDHADDPWVWLEVRGRNLLEDPVIEGAVVYARDVTDRKRRERYLQRYRQLVETVGDPMYALDEEGHVELVNGALLEYLDTERESIVGIHASEFMAGDGYERGSELIRELLGDPDRTAAAYEVTLQSSSGEEILVEINLSAIVDESGEYRGSVGAVREITERKRRETKLRKERDREKALFLNASDAIVFGEYEGEVPMVRDVNPAFEETFGYDASEAIDQPIDEIVLPDDENARAGADDINRRVKAGDRVETEVRRRTADGLRTFMLRSVPANLEDDGNYIYAIYQDVTDQRRYERMLRTLHEASERLFTAQTREEASAAIVHILTVVLDQPYNAVFLHEDDSLRIDALSESARETFGPPARIEAEQGLVGHVYEHGERVVLADARDDPRASETAPAEVRGCCLLPLDDFGVIMIASPEVGALDPEEVELAAILGNHARIALERITREAALRKREQELERQNQRLESFASLISHDLRNPLTVARGRLALAQDECSSEHQAAVERAHQRMEELIDDILALARQGTTVTDRERVDLAEAIERCAETVETEEARLEIDTDRVLRAEPSRLQRLLENLVRNAIEHGRPDVTVTFGDLPGGFYVADDGPGIPADERDTVFEAGYSTSDEGTGFGLSIVRGIAEAHGWSVRSTESESGGARFEVTDVDTG